MSEDTKSLRDQYRACIKLANETDSKKETNILMEEAKELMVKLRAECKHEETVITSPHYPSWSSYEDPEPEMRLCFRCGLVERELFACLIGEPIGKFHYRNLWGSDVPDQLRHPLNYLLSELKEFVEASGPKKIVRNLSTPESRKFWDDMVKISEEARKLPDWQNAGVNLSVRNYEMYRPVVNDKHDSTCDQSVGYGLCTCDYEALSQQRSKKRT